MLPDEGGLRTHEPAANEDQARAGGCCICPEGCMGLDPSTLLEGMGVWIGCDPYCGWCMNGCPARAGEPCGCLTEAAIT